MSTGSGIKWSTPYISIANDASNNVILGSATPSAYPKTIINGNLDIYKQVLFYSGTQIIFQTSSGYSTPVSGMSLVTN